MSTPTTEDAPKSKKPSNSAFKQQKLKAWQPILTAGTVLPMFFGVGIAFIPIGIGLLISSNMVQEHVVDYTQCKNDNGETCADLINNRPQNCICNIQFTLSETFKGDVYLYYGLSNFYQNHRRYVKSRDDTQLSGTLVADPKLTDCYPYSFVDTVLGNEKKPIAPCGAIANSLFNDTLELSYYGSDISSTPTTVHLLSTGIAWPTDKTVKFHNPPGNLTAAFEGYSQPVNWNKSVIELDTTNEDNNGFQNEDLIVWMRTAALPTFRKLYRRIDHSQSLFRNQMPSGTYLLTVNYTYPVTQFEGTKRMILSTTSWLGGKNSFLGIAYIVVGCICLVLGFVFLVIHIKFGKSTHDSINISQRTAF